MVTSVILARAKTAAAMTAGFADRSLSPVEVTRAVLERIDACEPVLNAMWTVDHNLALEAARASEGRWRRGAPLTVAQSVAGLARTIEAHAGEPGLQFRDHQDDVVPW